MVAACQTDVGKMRSQNQDTVFVSTEPVGPLPNLFIVADGMGGHNAGDVASQYAVSCFCAYLQSVTSASDGYLDVLVAAAAEANRCVFERASSDASLFGMGTTLTACVVADGKCAITHIGDSRAYMIANGRIVQWTTDHSYVNEMVKAGQLTQVQAREHPKRNILTRVLGIDQDMEADGYIRETEPDCIILLCSDGLTNMLTDETILRIAGGNDDPTRRVQQLIAEANANGGNDNISVVVVDL